MNLFRMWKNRKELLRRKAIQSAEVGDYNTTLAQMKQDPVWGPLFKVTLETTHEYRAWRPRRAGMTIHDAAGKAKAKIEQLGGYDVLSDRGRLVVRHRDTGTVYTVRPWTDSIDAVTPWPQVGSAA